MATSRPNTIAKVVKLDVQTKERLERLSQSMHRTPHWLMKEAIKLFIEEQEREQQLKQETLNRWQEAENGKIVSHQAVVEWLNTWGTDKERERPKCGN